MSLYDYRASLVLAEQDPPFYGLIMEAMRKADSKNIEKLRMCWPDVWEELGARYNSPGGLLPGEKEESFDSIFNMTNNNQKDWIASLKDV